MNAIEPVIYLDMDGVCVDFPTSVIRRYGLKPKEVFAYWRQEHAGKFSEYEIMGIRDVDFWGTAGYDESFWIGLKEYPWFNDLYNALIAIAPVVFLSSPGTNPRALSGKLEWLQARLGAEFQGYIFTTQKYLLAKPNTVLIDDYQPNLDAFRRAGGRSILFPQIWGSNHHIEDKVGYTVNEVNSFLQGIS